MTAAKAGRNQDLAAADECNLRRHEACRRREILAVGTAGRPAVQDKLFGNWVNARLGGGLLGKARLAAAAGCLSNGLPVEPLRFIGLARRSMAVFRPAIWRPGLRRAAIS